jgi:hypothetical protein
LNWKFVGNGGIDFVGAGRQGPTYSERVNTFDWKRFYQLGGRRLLDQTRASLINQYDFVLIDSRTGVSDTSGICTMQMPDVLVACLTLNRQSIEGVASILNSIRSWQNNAESLAHPAEKRRDISFYPVATRIEGSEQEKLELARAHARKVLAPFLSKAESRDLRSYWDDMEVTYRPFYAYEEILASFGDTAGAAGSKKTLLSEMEVIGQRVSERRDLRTPEIPDLDRQRVLGLYSFGKSPEQRDIQKIDKSTSAADKNDERFLRGIYAKEVIWRRSNYNYRNLLGRRELQQITADEQSEFGRQMAFFHANSQLFSSFRERTNNIFVWLWVGFMGLIALQLAELYLRRFPGIFFRSSLQDFRSSLEDLLLNEQFVTGFLISLQMVFFVVIAVRVLSAYRSPMKPYGMRLYDVMLLSLIGPFGREIKDFDIDGDDQLP